MSNEFTVHTATVMWLRNCHIVKVINLLLASYILPCAVENKAVGNNKHNHSKWIKLESANDHTKKHGINKFIL